MAALLPTRIGRGIVDEREDRFTGVRLEMGPGTRDFSENRRVLIGVN